MNYLYPMSVFSDSIMWSVIRPDGRELWGKLLHCSVDPLPMAMRALPGKIIEKCSRDDDRVIMAQEAGFS